MGLDGGAEVRLGSSEVGELCNVHELDFLENRAQKISSQFKCNVDVCDCLPLCGGFSPFANAVVRSLVARHRNDT